MFSMANYGRINNQLELLQAISESVGKYLPSLHMVQMPVNCRVRIRLTDANRNETTNWVEVDEFMLDSTNMYIPYDCHMEYTRIYNSRIYGHNFYKCVLDDCDVFAASLQHVVYDTREVYKSETGGVFTTMINKL